MNSKSHSPTRQSRNAKAILLFAVVLAPLVLYGARMALQSTSNDPRQWLPKTFAETDTYDWFQEQFGSDEFAVASWPGCTIDDPRLKRLADALEQSPYFDRALSGQQVIRQLTGRSLGLRRAAAVRRLTGILIGPKDETSCLVLTTSKAGQDDRSGAVAEIERLALEVNGLQATELRLAGPTVDAAAIDAESRRLLFQLAGISALVSFFVASLRLGSFRMAIAVLSIASYGTALALAMLYFSGGRMNLLMTMLPPLVYVLTISSAVHLANYYFDAVRTGLSATSAASKAVAQGWLPCSLAAGTTGVGLVSLATSKIEPIQMFGIYAALGVVVSVGVLFLLLPAALRLFPPKPPPPTEVRSERRTISRAIVGTIIQNHFLITVSGLVLIALCGSRIPNIKSTVRLQDRFLESSDALTDYRWLEEHIGPMVPLEVVVHIDKDDPRDQFEQIQLVATVQRKIHSLDQPVATMSAVNLCPPLPKAHSVRGIIGRKVIGSPRTKQRLTDANFVRETADQRLWRISVRAPALGDLDYGFFVEKIRGAVAPLLAQAGVEGTYTGIIPLIYKAQRQLLQDLFRSFLVAFAVIAVVLVFVLRSVVAALLSMVPNVFPAVIIFGGIEWAGIPVQIGSVMTASAALGIAVDDTVHVLTWFRRGLDNGLSRGEAIHDAFERCSGAMVHTTLICSCGLLVFALSSFVPILHFAWLMVFLLLSALVGDLLLLPAILAGPAGRWFEKAKTVKSESPDKQIVTAGSQQ
jgi:predicted RND superfamily exporter protein